MWGHEEFTRAMFCPEVEAERARAEQDAARAEIVAERKADAKIADLKRRFVFLDRGPMYGGMDNDIFGVRVTFSREQLANMIGNWDDVKDFIWYAISDQIMSLIRPPWRPMSK